MSSRGGNDGRPPRDDGDGVFVERVQTGKISVAFQQQYARFDNLAKDYRSNRDAQ